MKLSDAFPRNHAIVKALSLIGIHTVEQAKARLREVELTRNVGKKFLSRLMNINAGSMSRPKREDFCRPFTDNLVMFDKLGYIDALEAYCSYLETKIKDQ